MTTSSDTITVTLTREDWIMIFGWVEEGANRDINRAPDDCQREIANLRQFTISDLEALVQNHSDVADIATQTKEVLRAALDLD